uniref:WPP domain-containing protein n=1 Tax=Oryza glumipatula TaxID=40148 RepID=A0A0E0AM61_9ORYZ
MAEDAPSAAAAEGSQHASAAEGGSAAAAAPAAPAAKAAEALLPSLSIWPPSQRTRDAVVRRLVQTLAAPSILSQRYGAVPEAEAERAAAAVEAEAYAAVTESSSAAAAPASVEDGIEVLQAYSKEVSRRLLELAKSRAAPSPAAAAPAEGAASESEAAAAPAPVEEPLKVLSCAEQDITLEIFSCYVVLNGIPVISAMFFHKCELTIKQDNCIFALAIPLTAVITSVVTLKGLVRLILS